MAHISHYSFFARAANNSSATLMEQFPNHQPLLQSLIPKRPNSIPPPTAHYAALSPTYFTSTAPSLSPAHWLSDTGANYHATPDHSSFTNAQEYVGINQLRVGNGKGLNIVHIGSGILSSPSKNFSLQNILHAPQLITNLLSVQQFTIDNEVFFEFHPSCFLARIEQLRLPFSKARVKTDSTAFLSCHPFLHKLFFLKRVP